MSICPGENWTLFFWEETLVFIGVCTSLDVSESESLESTVIWRRNEGGEVRMGSETESWSMSEEDVEDLRDGAREGVRAWEVVRTGPACEGKASSKTLEWRREEKTGIGMWSKASGRRIDWFTRLFLRLTSLYLSPLQRLLISFTFLQ